MSSFFSSFIEGLLPLITFGLSLTGVAEIEGETIVFFCFLGIVIDDTVDVGVWGMLLGASLFLSIVLNSFTLSSLVDASSANFGLKSSEVMIDKTIDTALALVLLDASNWSIRPWIFLLKDSFSRVALHS